MRKIWVPALLGGAAAFAWSFVVVGMIETGLVSALALGAAIIFTVLTVASGWIMGSQPQRMVMCRECHAELGMDLAFGFCLHCGYFLSRRAEQYYAKHV